MPTNLHDFIDLNHFFQNSLPELCGPDFSQPVEILEFWLHEAMAQLQLGPLGESTAYMDENNIPLRSAFTSEFHARFDPDVEHGLNTVLTISYVDVLIGCLFEYNLIC